MLQVVPGHLPSILATRRYGHLSRRQSVSYLPHMNILIIPGAANLILGPSAPLLSKGMEGGMPTPVQNSI